MIVKTFSGATVRDALQKVRSAFGPDAVILDTKFDRGAESRLADAAATVTVTAAYAPDESVTEPSEGTKTLRLGGALAGESEDRTDTNSAVSEPVAPPPAEATSPAEPGISEPSKDDAAYRALADSIRRLHTGIARVQGDGEAGSLWSHLRSWLATQPELARGLADAFSTHLVESIPPPEAFNDKNKKGQTVLFIGDRGAGKSTALTKCLAARWRSMDRKPQVLVVSTSNRHGQERTEAWCAECEITFQAHALEHGRRLGRLKRRKGEDLFVEFVTGASEAVEPSRAKTVLRSLKPDVIVHVIPATESPRAWRAGIDRLAEFGATHLVVTHWDTLTPWWELLAMIRDTRLIPAYRTTGPEPFAEYEPLTESDLRAGLVDVLALTLGGEPTGGAGKAVTL